MIVAAQNAASSLDACLRALQRSTLPRTDWELIVVDDASTDETGEVAAARTDLLVRLPAPRRGPAYARNRGFEAARGAIVAFVDPRVAVHPKALENLLNLLECRPDIAAVSGRFDGEPRAPGLIARYRNLVRRLEHCPGDASTFWAGLGAVRASVFDDAGRFDEWHHHRASAEDAELGHRLRLLDRRVVIADDVTCTCLAEPGWRTLLGDDVREQVMPGVRLRLQLGTSHPDRRRSRTAVATSMAAGFWVAVLAAVLLRDAWWGVAAAAALAGLFAADGDVFRFIREARGPAFTLAVAPLHIAATTARLGGVIAGWAAHTLVGPPQVPLMIVVQAAFEQPGWPPRPVRPRSSVWSGPPGWHPDPRTDVIRPGTN